MNELDNILEHFGVKGMKWGVRKSRSERSAAKTDRQIKRGDKRFDRRAKYGSDYFKVYNQAADKMNRTEIARINNKPQYKGQDFRKDSPLRQKYYKEMTDTFTKALNEASASIIGTNASGTKRVEFSQDPNLVFPDFRVVDVKQAKHAEGDVDLETIFNSMGFITSFSIVDPVAHDALVEDFLSHHGIKGMKWGVRRQRGTDGRVVVEQKGRKLKTSGGSGHPATEEARRAAGLGQKAKASGSHALSNDELNDLVKRLELESKYSSLTTKKSDRERPGTKFAADILQNVAKQQVTQLASNYASQAMAEALGKKK